MSVRLPAGVRLAVLAAGCLLAANPVMACAVCFGDPDSDMAKSALAGVFFLGAVILGVLVTIASLAVSWSIRARRLQQQTDLHNL